MYSIHELTPRNFYIAFPSRPDGLHIPSMEIYDWITRNIPDPQWGIVNNQTVGVFLSHEDASAFKLVFGSGNFTPLYSNCRIIYEILHSH